VLTLPEPRRIRDGSTSGLSASVRALFADDYRRMPNTYDLPKAGRWGARSAMNSLSSRYAAGTTARLTAAAMRPHGGKSTGVDPVVAARALWLETRRGLDRLPSELRETSGISE
jgi:hypothetical protein